MDENRTITHPLAVSPDAAAGLLGIGRTRLYELLSSRELPSFTLGRRRLIRLSAIEAWITSQEEAARR
jgi:excisionase family DNA binding protein